MRERKNCQAKFAEKEVYLGGDRLDRKDTVFRNHPKALKTWFSFKMIKIDPPDDKPIPEEFCRKIQSFRQSQKLLESCIPLASENFFALMLTKFIFCVSTVAAISKGC